MTRAPELVDCTIVTAEDLSLLLAACGPTEWLRGTQWPLHQSLRELRGAVREGESLLPYGSWRSEPDAGVGLAIAGVKVALGDLALEGVIELSGFGLTETYVVQSGRLVESRRHLMRLSAADADLIYRAARRWDTLADTSLKNWRIASTSSLSAVN